MHSPVRLALDKQGNVYVCEIWANRVQVFTKTGEYLRMIGRRGMMGGDAGVGDRDRRGLGCLDSPQDVEVVRDMVVVGRRNGVQVFRASDGEFMARMRESKVERGREREKMLMYYFTVYVYGLHTLPAM